MRFAVAHKAVSYLMVGCAYLALVGGGGVAPPLALAGAGALIASWWWEPPLIRYERWALTWTIASVLALVYAGVTAVMTADFLGVGAQFLIWLLVAKAFNRRAARDWQQLYLLAFLMLVAGSVLNPELTYGACFLGFVIAATWALTLFHLRREMEDNLLVKHAADRASERVEVRRILDSRRIVGGRFFVGTGALSLAVFLGAALVFLALPRVGVGFFVKGRAGLTLAVSATDGSGTLTVTGGNEEDGVDLSGAKGVADFNWFIGCGVGALCYYALMKQRAAALPVSASRSPPAPRSSPSSAPAAHPSRWHSHVRRARHQLAVPQDARADRPARPLYPHRGRPQCRAHRPARLAACDLGGSRAAERRPGSGPAGGSEPVFHKQRL